MKKNKILLFFILVSFKLYSDSFTIAVIPDTQSYVLYTAQKNYKKGNYPINQSEVFYRQMSYIANNSYKNGGDIYFAIHLGDLVNSFGKKISEWQDVDYGFSLLDDIIPFGVVPGNHDYDDLVYIKSENGKRLIGGEVYKSFFGPESKHFKNKEWYGGASPNSMSSYSYIKTESTVLLFIGLELEPSDESINWAQKIIEKNKSLPTILVTHEYIGIDYDSYNIGNSKLLNQVYRKGFDRNTPLQLWNKFIKKNDQIFLVLCGHDFKGDDGEGVRVDVNSFGNKVYSLLSNYQGRHNLFKEKNIDGICKECGDGWIRLLNFDTTKNQIAVKTYSTEFNKFEKDFNSDFLISFDWEWDSRFYHK